MKEEASTQTASGPELCKQTNRKLWYIRPRYTAVYIKVIVVLKGCAAEGFPDSFNHLDDKQILSAA